MKVKNEKARQLLQNKILTDSMLPQHKINLRQAQSSKNLSHYSDSLKIMKKITSRKLIDPSEVYNKVYSGEGRAT